LQGSKECEVGVKGKRRLVQPSCGHLCCISVATCIYGDQGTCTQVYIKYPRSQKKKKKNHIKI